MLKEAIETQDVADMPPICHRIPVRHPDGGLPTTYTVDLTPDIRGTFLVTCRELPEVATFGETEQEALALAKLAIEEALAARPSSLDFSD